MSHHKGDLTVTQDNVEYVKTLTSVGGWLYILAECTLPALTSVGDWLDIRAECTLPALTNVGTGLDIHAECTLPALTSVGAGLYIHAECTLPALTSVGAGLEILAECTLPALTVAFGVPGKLIAVSEYGLWQGDNGLYYAGCRRGLTLRQALDHWNDRDDERALKFISAINNNINA
jgi:carbonic anhydrase/acetyltransferase-like protein (isoleucine patch superfamily)